ncbi:hypothetical protein BBL_1206 [Burkholderia pseudomallei MSHR1328]|nr:hypothetical protein Y042_552 [Burkholderia pseudomallei MSHR1357]KKC10639.1 hypothetical protein BBL_1206 [Burkholderia pseudomallei MSHR1328]
MSGIERSCESACNRILPNPFSCNGSNSCVSRRVAGAAFAGCRSGRDPAGWPMLPHSPPPRGRNAWRARAGGAPLSRCGSSRRRATRGRQTRSRVPSTCRARRGQPGEAATQCDRRAPGARRWHDRRLAAARRRRGTRRRIGSGCDAPRRLPPPVCLDARSSGGQAARSSASCASRARHALVSPAPAYAASARSPASPPSFASQVRARAAAAAMSVRAARRGTRRMRPPADRRLPRSSADTRASCCGTA